MIDIDKFLIVVGLTITLAGLILMIDARTYRDKEGKKWGNTHAIISPNKNRYGWTLTIIGYLLQIIGTIGVY